MNRTFLIAILTFYIAGCASTPTQWAENKTKLSVIATYARSADIEPCGCSSHSLGGFVREANYLEKLKPEHKNRLLVSAGTTFVPHLASLLKGNEKQYILKAKYVVDGNNENGLDVLSPSAHDFALGINSMREIAKKAKFKIVSANLMANDKRIFAPYAEFTYEGQKVYVTGVTHFDSDKGYRIDSNLRIHSPQESLEKVFAEIPKNAFVILLSDLKTEDRDALLIQFPQIRVVIGNKDVTDTHRGATQFDSDTVKLSIGDRARMVSRVTVQLGPNSSPFYNEAISKKTASDREVWEARLAALKKSHKAGSLDPEVLAMTGFLAETKGVPLSQPANYLGFDSEFVELDQQFDKPDNGLSKIIDGYKAKVRELALKDQ